MKKMDLVTNAKSAPSLAVGKVGDEGLIYVDTTAVAPSPSRDYYRLHVTSEFVRMTRWQISHRSSPMLPTETKVALDKYHCDKGIMSEVGRIFGKPLARYIAGLSQGHFDTIVRLPLQPLALIMEYVGIESLDKLAPVCKRFQEVASGNRLWKALYRAYAPKGPLPKDTEDQAKHYGWKTVFLIHRLQDQVFRGKSMRLGLSHPDEAGGDFEGPGKGPLSKLAQRQLQQEQHKLASSLFPPKPLRPTKSLDDYLREGASEAGLEETDKVDPSVPSRSSRLPASYYSNPRALLDKVPRDNRRLKK